MKQAFEKDLPADLSYLDKNWKITKKFHKKIYKKAEPFLLTRSNTIHTRIVYHFALHLLKTEPGDPDVVIPAALLHDVGWSRVPEDRQIKGFGPNIKNEDLQKVHEVEGSKIARKILEDMGYPARLTDEIEEIIVGHDSRLDAIGENDKLVKDSDKLWRFSFEGFTIDYIRFNHSPRENLDWLMGNIPSWFFLERSRKLASKESEARKLDYNLM